MAVTAFSILQEKQDAEIKIEKLKDILLETRYDPRRMSRKKASTDTRFLFDYLHDRSGLLAAKDKNKGKNLISFAYRPFLDYLCAYQVSKDLSKSQPELIDELLGYMENLTWQEPILISLYLLEKFSGASFIDTFTEAAFKKLDKEKNPRGWFLLGLAIRDNTDFAPEDIKRILRELINIWIKGIEKKTAVSILQEINIFSKGGKNILNEVMKENKREDCGKISLYNQLQKLIPIHAESQ